MTLEWGCRLLCFLHSVDTRRSYLVIWHVGSESGSPLHLHPHVTTTLIRINAGVISLTNTVSSITYIVTISKYYYRLSQESSYNFGDQCRYPPGPRNFSLLQTFGPPLDSPILLFDGYRPPPTPPGIKSTGYVTLTSHLHLVPTLRMCAATRSLLQCLHGRNTALLSYTDNNSP